MEKAMSHRGFMLDVSRHYMPVENIRRLLDAAEICCLNIMHWHLADDQAWRIEIRKYPLLTQIGSVRGNSFFGDVSETENNCGFYTQDEVRDIVAYAKERGIDIIPEIEIPGHASAMLAAYPEHGCRRTIAAADGLSDIENPYEYSVMNKGGIFPNLICAGKEDAVAFMKDILAEVAGLFPYPAVHIGGDEALKLHWRRCPDCQRRIREEGLKGEEELQRSLILEMGDYLASLGKSTIVYNDCLAGGLLPGHFIVHHWLGNDEETRAFMQAGGRVIRSDLEDFYFDYPYSSVDVEHIRCMRDVPLYAEGCEDRLIGFECMLWAERITCIDRAAYLLFPRLPAMAMRLDGKSRSREDFFAELKDVSSRIEALGLHGAPERDWALTPEDAEADRQNDLRMRTSPGAKQAEKEECRLLLQEDLERLLAAIEMPREFALRIMDHVWSALPVYSGNNSSEVTDGADRLAEHLVMALESREDGSWKDVPEEIWLDTMKAFTRFVMEHKASTGRFGFDRAFWTTRQAEAKLFRIGELEYEPVIEEGQRCISLHIPSDTCMKADGLNRSVAEARKFIAMKCPDWADAPIVCRTWLLAPVLKQLLPAGSNILRFQRAFDILETDAENNDVLEWVFRLTEEQQENVCLADLPEDTSLQRAMKAHLLAGGKVGVGCGVLARDFCE